VPLVREHPAALRSVRLLRPNPFRLPVEQYPKRVERPSALGSAIRATAGLWEKAEHLPAGRPACRRNRFGVSGRTRLRACREPPAPGSRCR